MYFSQSRNINKPVSGRILYNLEEQFIVHPLNIESQHQPWREIGERLGKAGASDCRVRYRNLEDNILTARYDIPMSPRRLHYKPFVFYRIFIKIQCTKSMELTLRTCSSYPDEADYFKEYKILAEHSFKLRKGLNVLSFSLEKFNQKQIGQEVIPFLSGIEIEFSTPDSIEVYAPICETDCSVAIERLRNRYCYWLDCVQFDQEILRIHQITSPVIDCLTNKLSKIVEKFNSTQNEHITPGYLEKTAKQFCEWPQLVMSLFRLVGVRTELDYIAKRLNKLKNCTDQQKCYERLAENYSALRKQIITNPDDTQIIVDFKEQLDKLEQEIWTKWCASGLHAQREGKIIYTAEGERMSLMGINDYDIGVDQPCNEDDYMYMQLLGYRLIRMPVWHKLWDENTNCFKPHYIEKYLQCVRWAAKYGLNVIFELHYIPECIMNEMRHSPKDALFYDAIECETWLHEQLTFFMKQLKNNPALAIVEVPSNEPYLHENSRRHSDIPLENHSIVCNPFLMRRWNEFLQQKHTTRKQLGDAWSRTINCSSQLGLDESWDDYSILPPGQDDSSMAYNSRLYDYISWFQSEHNGVCQRLAETVKAIAPGKLISMAQASHSGIFSLDPPRLDGIFFYQNTPEIIDLATIHYNLGECKRLSSMPIPGYAGEEYGQDVKKWQWAWENGCGVLPWGWSTRWRKGEDLLDLDENGYVWKDKRHLPLNQKKLLTYPIPPKPLTAILSSKRLITRGEHLWKNTAELLEAMEIEYDLLDQDLIVDRPELLKKYRFVIFENKYADPQALKTVAQSETPALFIGEVGFDAHAGFGKNGLLAGFCNAGLFLSTFPEWHQDDFCLKLDTQWEMGTVNYSKKSHVQDERLMFSRSSTIAPDEITDLSETAGMDGWHPVQVPMAWTSFNDKLERAWLRTTFTIPRNWSILDDYSLQIGGIDDFDWTFINDRYVGGEQITWNQEWKPGRIYEIGQNVLTSGNNNLYIRIQNQTGIGGIWDGPVSLLRRPSGKFNSEIEGFKSLNGNEYSFAPYSPNLHHFLTPNAKLIAALGKMPLIIQQKNKVLFLGDNYLHKKNQLHRALIEFMNA